MGWQVVGTGGMWDVGQGVRRRMVVVLCGRGEGVQGAVATYRLRAREAVK